MQEEPRLIVIIGLPGSGKTELMNKYSISNYELFDDFVTSFFIGRLSSYLRQNKKVCACDPRLCLVENFQYYFNKFTEIVPTNSILIILFENNPEQCINNINLRTREQGNEKQNILNNVRDYSKNYDLKNYANCNCVIKPVFRNAMHPS